MLKLLAFPESVTRTTQMAVGSSGTFMLQMIPTSPGNKIVTVTIPNDDVDENPYSFTITGKGVSGDVNLKYAGADFIQNTNVAMGSAVPGRPSSAHTFTVENLGYYPLHFQQAKYP